MAKYRVEIKRSAQKEIRSLSGDDLKRVLKKIESLSQDPRGPDCKKLSGQEKYRIRVGNYRILYEIHDTILVVTVVKVAHRKDAYR